ncbi:MAG: 50S ribosomal protein L21 [bacterium]|nr:50S ribosomal protein L21 [bacterium]
MIAVIQTGGKQYVVKQGDVLDVEKLELKQGETVSFDALLKAEGDKVEVGTPTLTAKVTAEVVEQGRAKKVSVVHYKPKVRSTKRVGHRQPFTTIKITTIA